jgi:hypothetical protein
MRSQLESWRLRLGEDIARSLSMQVITIKTGYAKLCMIARGISVCMCQALQIESTTVSANFAVLTSSLLNLLCQTDVDGIHGLQNPAAHE